MKKVSLSSRPWFETFTLAERNQKIEKAISKCGYKIMKISLKEIEEFISLNPTMTKFGFEIDKYFDKKHIGTDEFFSLLNNKIIYYRRVTEYSDSQKSWLKKKFENTVCIFNEMHEIDEDIFNQLGLTYINIFMPPVRFVKITRLKSLYSNDEKIMKILKENKYPNWGYTFFLAWMKITRYSSYRKINKNKKIKPNSCLIIGQNRFDYSKFDYNKKEFIQLSNYKADILSFIDKYDAVYYTKHPHEKSKHESNFLSSLGVNIIDDITTYDLLLSNKIVSVCALSSSVLTEAEFLNKKTYRLFTNFVDMHNKYINISNRNLRKRSFWAAVLGTKK